MGRAKKQQIREIFEFDGHNSICKQQNCTVVLKGDHHGNLYRHISKMHREILDEMESEASNTPQKKRKIQIEICEEGMVKAMVDLIAKEGTPFSLLDSDALRTLTTPICRALHIPIINAHNIIDHLEATANIIRAQIKKMVSHRLLCLKIDCASRLDRRVLGM